MGKDMFHDPVVKQILTSEQQKSVLRLTWLYKAKCDSSGMLSHIKARIVADGSTVHSCDEDVAAKAEPEKPATTVAAAVTTAPATAAVSTVARQPIAAAVNPSQGDPPQY